jgi:hypothetical protein
MVNGNGLSDDDERIDDERIDDDVVAMVVIVVKSKDLVLDKGDFTSNETLARARTRKAGKAAS